MGWNLEIHTIDVGQGESSLIIARKDDNSVTKSLLIDGGLAKYGRLVDNYVKTQLGAAAKVDVIVTTHYDTDHSGGITTLLQADNVSLLAMKIAGPTADAVTTAIGNGGNNINQALIGMSTFTAIVAGAYKSRRQDKSGLVQQAVTAVLQAFNAELNKPATVDDALNYAYRNALDYMLQQPLLDPDLLKTFNTGHTRDTGKQVVNAAMAAQTNVRKSTAITTFFQRYAPPGASNDLVRANGKNYNFFTGGRYSECEVYNPGRVDDPNLRIPTKDLTAYFNAVTGVQPMVSYNATVPNLQRTTSVPALGEELLGIADADAPKVYCIAVLQKVLGNNQPTISQDNGNGIGIAMIVVFNKFVFYTGGDLPADGLDQIPGVVLNKALFGSPATIPAFKAGHHGSDGSNTQNYITTTAATTCLISTGGKKFGRDDDAILPRQDVIDWLVAQNTMPYFFLTNCKIVRNGVPFSNAQNQLVNGNKSRISGDNGLDPGEKATAAQRNPKQNRGNIVLTTSTARSNSDLRPPTQLKLFEVYRSYLVNYWEFQPGLFPPNPTGISQITITF